MPADQAELRSAFNEGPAKALAAEIRIKRTVSGPSPRFAYFEDTDHFVVIAGPQEEGGVDLTLPYGLAARDKKRLVLIVPERQALATLQRAAWLAGDARPIVYLHDGRHVSKRRLPGTNETLQNLARGVLKNGQGPDDELRATSTAPHLRDWGSGVLELIDLATDDPRLEPAHQRGERAWRCMGRKVLSIKIGEDRSLHIRAGNRSGEPTDADAWPLAANSVLQSADRAAIWEAVDQAVEARLLENRRDEQWFQAVIRREPSIVGIEHPSWREVPAWRPVFNMTVGRHTWGRGYIDLVGLDAHGDIRIVETNLAENRDDLLVAQGLDDYVWAQLYEKALRERLGAPRQAQIVVHFAVGLGWSDGDATQVIERYVPLLRALDDKIRWTFQAITDWHMSPPNPKDRPTSTLFGRRDLPTA